MATEDSRQDTVSWQQCHICGGPFIVWRDPAAPPIHEAASSVIRPEWFMHLDGRPVAEGEIITCDSCGSTDYAALLPMHRRWHRVPVPGWYRVEAQ